MLNRDISDSKGFASLTAEAAVLFCMMVPHFDSHGKMCGDPGYIKAVVCPRIAYLTIEKVACCLGEITEHTNVKWFCFDERCWIHSTKFLTEHQHLNPERLGKDLIPDYVATESGLTPDLFAHQCPAKVKVKVKDKVKSKARGATFTDDEYVSSVKHHYNAMIDDPNQTADWKKFYEGVLNIDDLLFAACTWLIEHPRNRKSNFKQFYGNWLRNAFQNKTQPRRTA